ncbi:SUKH-4 family immunity protein [Spirillospora sp. NPDC052242]
MNANMGGRLAAHFGPEGLRRFAPAELHGLALPEPAARELVGMGLPVQVGPYFTATAGEPLPLGEYGASVGFPDVGPDEFSWCRLGTDRGAELCVTPTGAVRAVTLGPGAAPNGAVPAAPVPAAPPMHVNADVTAFAASLLELDAHLPVIAAPGEQDAAAVFRRLRGRLLEIDGPALRDAEAWWPRVLEAIRHALSFPFAAAFRIDDGRGGSRIETETARPGAPHPERVLWARLAAAGVRPAQVTRIHTDLEPCSLPGNHCARLLERFPNAARSHGFDYGDTAASREAGLLALMHHAAAQNR